MEGYKVNDPCLNSFIWLQSRKRYAWLWLFGACRKILKCSSVLLVEFTDNPFFIPYVLLLDSIQVVIAGLFHRVPWLPKEIFVFLIAEFRHIFVLLGVLFLHENLGAQVLLVPVVILLRETFLLYSLDLLLLRRVLRVLFILEIEIHQTQL